MNLHDLPTSLEETLFNPAAVRLDGKRILILGVANASSIAYGCAAAMRSLGAELALTYLNDKAKPHVQPLAEQLGVAPELLMPMDLRQQGSLESVFETVRQQWGKLDAVVHSIAFAPAQDLHGPLVDSSADGFLQAMDISCHSFIRTAKLAVPLMTDGGQLISMSYHGAQEVVDNYGLMGPVKAALECTVRYLANELGEQNIRVNAVSPGPMRTRASSGINEFDALIEDAVTRAPLGRLVTLEEVGYAAAQLCTLAGSGQTGSVVYVDGGHNIKA